MYKACIFDLDGTLLDTLDSISMCANGALEKYGLAPHKREMYKYFAGDGQKTLVDRAVAASGGDDSISDGVLAEYRRLFADGCTYNVKPYDGIKHMLDALKAGGVMIAVLTNKPHPNAINALEREFGAGYFDCILGIKDGVKLKPDPQGAETVMSKLGVNRDECLYIGDTIVDMRTGKGAGIFTVGVTWGFRDEDELRAGNADAVIERPEEILSIAGVN